MNRQSSGSRGDGWQVLLVPEGTVPPAPIRLRAQIMPARSGFPEHAHGWNQLVYAISGVLTVAVEGRRLVVPPQQAVWVPTGVPHQVSTLHGAEFRSLYVADPLPPMVGDRCVVLSVTPLLRALVVEATTLGEVEAGDGYGDRVVRLMLDQLQRLRRMDASLPWPPSDGAVLALCERLYVAPVDPRDLAAWGAEFGMSARTLARHFERDLGMNLREWRRRLRLFKAFEMLGGGASVTRVAMDLGYNSPSAFTYMFRRATGQTPRSHRQCDA